MAESTVSAFGGAAVVTGGWNRPVVAAAGVYGGLLCYLLACADAPYPVASSVALAAHGFVPALLGGLAVWLWRRFARASARRWP